MLEFVSTLLRSRNICHHAEVDLLRRSHRCPVSDRNLGRRFHSRLIFLKLYPCLLFRPIQVREWRLGKTSIIYTSFDTVPGKRRTKKRGSFIHTIFVPHLYLSYIPLKHVDSVGE